MMKQIFKLAMVATLSVPVAFAAIENYAVDTEATKVEWIGKKVTGEHRGFVKVKPGSKISLSGNEITAADIIVDINALTVTDITDPEYATKFVGHMKSPDFFNTEKYPEAKLVITKSKATKDGLEVEGNLTILDKTQPVKFKVSAPQKKANVYSSKATIVIDRTKFGLRYGSGQFFKDLGDKMIYDDFTLNIELNAKKI